MKGLYNIKNFCYSPNKRFRNPSEIPRETFRLGPFDLEALERQEKRIFITSSYLGRVCLSCLSKIRANRLERFWLDHDISPHLNGLQGSIPAFGPEDMHVLEGSKFVYVCNGPALAADRRWCHVPTTLAISIEQVASSCSELGGCRALELNPIRSKLLLLATQATLDILTLRSWPLLRHCSYFGREELSQLIFLENVCTSHHSKHSHSVDSFNPPNTWGK